MERGLNNQSHELNKEELIKVLTQQSKEFHPNYEHSIKLGFDMAVVMVKELLEGENNNEKII